ncbi:MAG: amidohydrolase family protein, partial [Clostridia bacterium]|nr:amidohydrolase family protein [Clostridia bacterium]
VCQGVLPILFHAGDHRYEFSAPKRIAKIAKLFPGLTIIAAHFGGYHRWDEVDVYEGLDNVYFDTCSSFFMLSADRAKELIYKFGTDKFLFGTDYPMWKAEDEVENILNLHLSDEDNQKIFYKNAEKLLRL